MERSLSSIAKQFQFDGTFVEAVPHDSGHINETYIAHVRGSAGHSRRYVLQRINQHVFRDPAGLMRNMKLVTDHLRAKVMAAGGNPERETLTLVPTEDGEVLHQTSGGEYWRAFAFIERARTYQMPENLVQVYGAAHAFGDFQRLLIDFPAGELCDTIPDFHNTPKRFADLLSAVDSDAANRAQSAAAEIQFVEMRADETSVLVGLMERRELSEHVTHNDTKFNNVMIDDLTGEGICVIDLDTVMPGLFLYDFGDLVRSAANPAAEDEQDLSQVHLSLEVYEQIVRGYLDAARSFLSPIELDHLAFSARLMTLECGMRFLTDYISGDVYFKVHREGHNLDRCRTQFALVRDMESKADLMEGIGRRRSEGGGQKPDAGCRKAKVGR